MLRGWLQQFVPGDLAVIVGVDINESGSYDKSGGVNGFMGDGWVAGVLARTCLCLAGDFDDLAVFDSNVAHEAVLTSAVNDGSVGD